jgi:hypothetical protein
VPRQAAFYFWAGALAVLLFLLVAFLGLLSLWRSSFSAETGGITAVAGGVSESVFSVFLAAATILLIVLFFIFRKLLKKR